MCAIYIYVHVKCLLFWIHSHVQCCTIYSGHIQRIHLSCVLLNFISQPLIEPQMALDLLSTYVCLSLPCPTTSVLYISVARKRWPSVCVCSPANTEMYGNCCDVYTPLVLPTAFTRHCASLIYMLLCYFAKWCVDGLIRKSVINFNVYILIWRR